MSNSVLCKSTQIKITFEGLVQLILPKNHPKIMNGTSMELHPEHNVSGWVSVSLVVTLELSLTDNREKMEKHHETLYNIRKM